MKICLLLQRRFAFIAHDLAILLQEKYGVKEFCGYVYTRSSYDFLQSQKDIRYTRLILDEDVHNEYKNEKLDLKYLKDLEHELGMPNLWPYLAIDRIVMFDQLRKEYPHNTPRYSHEEMMKILQVKARTVINFLDKEKPDAIVLPNIGSTAAFLLYNLAKKRGIKILYIAMLSIKDKYIISERYDASTGVEEIFKRNLSGPQKSKFYEEAKQHIHTFRNKPQYYDVEADPTKQPVNRLKQLQFILPKNFFRSFSWFAHLINEYFVTSYRYDYSYVHPWDYFKDRVQRKIRNLFGVNDLYDTYNPNEDYAFFPLHFEPETTLLLLAPFHTDQTHIIKQIARSLPLHYKLYVKEHPYMAGYRTRQFYKELKKIPNVKLIDPAIPALDIAQHTKLITTINGSTAWEGLMFKKPAICFGYQFYNSLSMVKRCREIEQLPYLIKEQLENFKYDEEELINFLAAILEDATTIDFQRLWARETDEVKKKKGLLPMADLIARKLGL